MKQNYFKSLLVTMLALFLCIGAYADTSTLTFTAKCNGSGTADDGAVWTVTSDGTESDYYEAEGIHYGTSSKNVSYLQLTTSGIPGTVSKVILRTRDTQAKANITVKVGNVSFTCSGSESVKASNSIEDYEFVGTGSGTITVRIDRGSSMTKAIYVKSIAVTYSTETPAGEKEPNNSFGGVTEDNATIGVGYTMPIFTTSSDGAKSYSSSNTDVATISNSGAITLLKAGTTTITVSTAQTATYAAGSASYILNVAKGTPELSFASESVTAYVGTDQNGPALTNPGDGDVTYEISDPEIATIQSTGYIHPLKAGTATVTATTAETEAWNSATAFYTLTVEEAFSVDAVGTYEWVKDASTLAAGDELVLAHQSTDRYVYAMGNQQDNNFKNVELIYPSDVTDRSVIIISSDKATDVTSFILEGSAGAWNLHTNNGYLCAVSTDNNYLRTTTTVNDYAKATITITDGDATIKFLGKNTRNIIRYNTQNGGLFSCYTSGQNPIQIYRKMPSNVPPTITFSPASGTEVNYGTLVTITARTATSITFSVNGGEPVTVNGTSATVTINTHTTITATATNEYGTSEEVTAEYTIHAESPAFTYDPTEYEITIGDDFIAPELGKAADYDGTITYSSNNTEVAEVDAETGAVTVKGAGTATITATGTATEHFNAATASYTLTVKKQESSVSFAESVVEITYGDNYDKQKATTEGVNGNLVYTSSDESVVKFHGNNVIDVLKAGTVTITATAPATDTTEESSATYTLKIYEPADDVVGTEELLNEKFDDCTGSCPKENIWWGSGSSYKALPESSGWTTSNDTPAGNGCLKVGNSGGGTAISPSFTLDGTTSFSFDIAPWLSSSDYGIDDGTITVTLTNATFNGGSNSNSVSFNTKEALTAWQFTNKQYEITGTGESVTITFGGTARFFLDNVVVGGGAQPAHEINLTFSSAGYLTWVATADIDFSQTADVTAYQITEATSKKITMEEVDKVPAGAAVMLKGSGTKTLKRTTEEVADLSDNKMLACTDGSVTGNGNGVTNTDVYVLGNGKSGLGFYMLKGTLQAGKGYLQVSEGTGNAKPNFISFEETTGVKTVVINKDSDGAVYNLQGIRVAHPQKGIYVKNGKKYVIK